ncbi:MAG TPA: helix-turn-helix domain-containing protein [Actinomycetes bacterium]|nr:helix-turn-helix domain-containing protein [Actinomycetes bacterium]
MLEAVGVSAEDESVYRCLLGLPRGTVAELAARLKRDQSKVRRALQRLEQHGLVSRLAGRPLRLLATRPDVAVDLLAARRREELNQAQVAARTLLSEMVVEDHHRPERLVEVVVGRAAVARRYGQLLQATTGELLVLDRPPYVNEPARGNDMARELMRSGVTVRGIYATESLDRPGALAEAMRSARAGEIARTHPAVPIKLAVGDRSLALLPLAVDDVAETALVVHSCGLLDALCALFELLWEQALPVIEPDGPAAKDQPLLAALAAGLKDDAIARQLGLSPRTVSRRIAVLMERLQARTRFQAGLLVQRSGKGPG